MNKIKEIPGPKAWAVDAACSNRPYEWFELPDNMQVEDWQSIRDKIAKGQEVCGTCLVAIECLLGATPEDRIHTVRGGKWPKGLSDGRVGRPFGYRTKAPKGLKIPEVPGEPDLCRNDHDKQIVGYYNGKCYECCLNNWRKTNENRDPVKLAIRAGKRAGEREALRAAKKAAWEAMDVCPQGHDLGPVEDRLYSVKGPYCYECRLAAKRATDKASWERRSKKPVPA